jgi:hypothetical protein
MEVTDGEPWASSDWRYAAPPQDTDTGGGVVRSLDPGSVTRGTACLTRMWIYAALRAATWGRPLGSSSTWSDA